MSTGDDKRRKRRIPVELWVELERGGELYFQRASNLSVSGVYFTQTFPLPVGTEVALRFTLPGEDRQIACRGEIVNAKELGMGVHFSALAKEDRSRIEALIDRGGG